MLVVGKGAGYGIEKSKGNLEVMGTSESIVISNHNDLQKEKLLPHFYLPSLKQIPFLANSNSRPYS